ncbi:catalase-related domain-containing protein, partial [Saccharopolyspora sp. NPDC050642]|uniref:catalase-related domain-containing protein n=1 Tax=Saccharopolyspora sp. NPDC050642 TaxID=3157099 RepID=UPI0033E6CC2C
NYFEQPGKLFRLMTAEEQQRLFENTANDMMKLRPDANCGPTRGRVRRWRGP